MQYGWSESPGFHADLKGIEVLVMATAAPIVGMTLQGIRSDLRMTLDDLVPSCASKTSVIQAWESEEKKPSDRQLEKLSNKLRTPFAAFFGQRVPKVTRPRDRRAYADRTGSDFATDTILVFKTAAEMQFAFDYLNGIEPVPVQRRLPKLTLQSDPYEAGGAFRQQIGLTRKHQKEWKSDEAYSAWRRIVESFGVLTMQADLEQDELRGFCFPAPWPLICVNSRDASNGKCFSLLHELGHIMLGEDSASGYSAQYVPSVETHERFCDRFANAAILPHENSLFQLELIKLQSSATVDILMQGLSRLASQYKVSRQVILFALKQHRRIDDSTANQVFAVLAAATTNLRRKGKGGPLPHIKEISRRGELYTSTIFRSMSNGTLSMSEASAFLNLKPKWLPEVGTRLFGLGLS